MRSFVNYFFVLFFTFALGYFFVFAIIDHLTDGFSLHKIESNIPHSKENEIPPLLNDEVKKILSQKFSYLGKGSQCYVFESEDGQHVLKFFRYSRYRLPWFAKYLSLPRFLTELQNQHLQTKKQKLFDLFTSCKLAFQELTEDSGLIFLHLNKTSSLNQTVVLYDNLKRPFSIDIDRYEFLIQRKGELIYPYLNKLITEGERDEAKKALNDLVVTLIHRFHKGIADNDAVIRKNLGFRNGKVQYLDVGQFSTNPDIKNPVIYKQEIKKIVQILDLWLQKKDEELALCFEAILTQI